MIRKSKASEALPQNTAEASKAIINASEIEKAGWNVLITVRSIRLV